MKRFTISVVVLTSVLITGCSSEPGGAPAPRTPAPLPTRTPLVAFGTCSPLALTRPVTFPPGQAPHAVVVGDLNGDGRPDLVVANREKGNVTLLLGDDSGGFRSPPYAAFAVGGGPITVRLGDLNGDGMLDLATANNRTNDVSILVNGCP